MRKAPAVRAALVLVGCLVSWVLFSCGLARLEQSAEDLQSSKGAYEAYLRTAESVDQCAKKKAIYEADLADYEAAIRPRLDSKAGKL